MHGNGTMSEVLVDALLAGGSSVVALLAGMTFLSVRADPGGVVFVGVIAFSTAFMSSLQAARGRGKKGLPLGAVKQKTARSRERNG